MWRIQPDLIIELGTSGGGGAFFYATIMQFYNPQGRVVTIGRPDVGSEVGSRGCAHCMPASETALWKSGIIRFIRGFPDAADVLKQVQTNVPCPLEAFAWEQCEQAVHGGRWRSTLGLQRR